MSALPAGYALRDATPDDAFALCEVVHASFREYEGKLDPPSGAHAETPESLKAKMARGGAVLVTKDGEPVGCGVFEWRDDHAYIGRLGTLPSHRKAGVGTALLFAAEERARAKGFTRVRLSTRTLWPGLRRYYEDHGYRTLAFGTHAGKEWPTYVDFEKELAQDAASKPHGFRLARFDHVQLGMPPGGEDAARAFYGGVLGLEEVAKPEGAGKGGVWFEGAGLQVHLGLEEGFAPPKKAHPGFRVRGLDALAARLVAAGSPPVPAPDLGGVRRFHARDPFGNRIEFLAETT